jgi:site-specific DNA-methyltransferase (adenine-specific)
VGTTDKDNDAILKKHDSFSNTMSGNIGVRKLDDGEIVEAKNKQNEAIKRTVELGRFPANLLHDNSDEVVGEFPNESERFFKSFLYCPKASKSERDRGCEGMEEKQATFGQKENSTFNGLSNSCLPVKNNHPTVKPLALMKYLIQMITPEGGTVLDPFAGSGSTLVAAKELGYDFIGIEMTEEYIPIIEARLNGVKDKLL